MDTRKNKKEDVGSTHGAKGQEDKLQGAKERSGDPSQMASLSVETALEQSMQEKVIKTILTN